MAEPARKFATFDDVLALGPEAPVEVLRGVIVERAAPDAEHADTQTELAARIRTAFGRRGGGDLPGGWWILVEVDIELEPHEVVRPDIAGWRRDRVPERPKGRPVRVAPHWVCEVVSTSNAENDLVRKWNLYRKHRVDHYWVADPARAVLTVHRWTESGYLTILQAGRGDVVRAEPFEAIEIAVGTLFGDEPV